MVIVDLTYRLSEDALYRLEGTEAPARPDVYELGDASDRS